MTGSTWPTGTFASGAPAYEREGRAFVVKRMQAGEVRLSLPQPDELRPALRAVS